MTTKYLWREGNWIDAALLARRRRATGPMVILDTTDAFQSMADGGQYDSKSAYRRSLKERGFVELGNDRPATAAYEPPSAEADIAKVLADYDA